MLGLGLGFGKLSSYKYTVKKLIDDYIKRVTAAGGYLEGNACATAKVRELNSQRLLDDASWLLIPEGIKEDVVYTQKPTSGLGDLTFTRASDATRTNSAGVIERTPWNLVTFSEQFDNAAWDKVFSTITGNTTTAPNGTLSADLFVPASGTLGRVSNLTGLVIVNATAYTGSIYFKKPALSIDNVTFYVSDSSGATGGNRFGVTVNLTNFTGVAYNFGNGVATSVSVVSVGDGWYRAIFTGSVSSGASGNFAFVTRVLTVNGTIDGTNGLFIWGAQLVEGTDAKPYFATTNRQDVPRLDYRNADGTVNTCPRLLLEPQRTNLCLQSEQVEASPWSTQGLTVSPNAILSPSSLNNADKIQEETSTGQHYLTQTITVSASTTYTMSMFAKKGERDIVYIRCFNSTFATTYCNISFNLTTGTVTGSNAKIESYPNGWYRCSATFTTIADTTLVARFNINSDGNYNGILNYGLYFWGAQLEAGTYATTYIPITTAAVTRLADVVTLASIPSSTSTSFTIFADFEYLDSSTGTFTFRNASNSLSYAFYYYNSSWDIFNGSAFITNANVVSRRGKIAIAHTPTTVKVFINGADNTKAGALPSTSLSQKIDFTPTTTQTATINNLLYIPSVLTNAQLVDLTGGRIYYNPVEAYSAYYLTPEIPSAVITSVNSFF